MADVMEGLLEQAKGLLPRAVALRRRIHQHPELGLDLPETRAAVLETLAGLELEIQLSERTSGVVATLRGARGGPTLLLRGDMDALPMPEDTDLDFRSRVPNAMHACGHDAHTAMLACAAQLLHGRREQLAGAVKFMFQPGEEGHAGAAVMLGEGILETDPAVDAAFAIHVFPLVPNGMVTTRRGPLMASADTFRVVVNGKGGHASMPHDALDPVPIACEMVQAMQALVTRRVNAFDPAVLSVTKIESGTTTNVIPETATLEGTIRTFSEWTRKTVHAGLERVARGIADAHGAGVDVQIFAGYPVTINDPDFADFVLDVSRELLGSDRVIEQPHPAMGAEDFSYVLQRVPGTMAILGVRPDGIEPAPCHSNRMVLNEEGMIQGIALHAAMALRFLDGESRSFAHPAR